MTLVFSIYTGPFDVHNQLFQAKYTRLPKSHCHEQEKDCDDDQAAEIEDLLVDLNKSDHLIVVHNHAERKVNPGCRLKLL